MSAAPFTLLAGSAVAALVLVVDGLYIVNEGHVGVVTRFGEAIRQEAPSGLQFKTPIMVRIREFDVREQQRAETMAAATANQLPITVEMTMNWRPDPEQMLTVYQNYGTPEAFANIILAPRMRQAVKAGLAEFQASDLIRDRQTAAQRALALMTEAMEPYPATVLSMQIENVELPERYREAVLAKEEARESAAREQYNLERQKLEAQRTVQTAEAEREANKARADGAAYARRQQAEAEADARRAQAAAEAEAIRSIGEAEAEAIKLQAEALQDNPLLVDLRRWQRWDGAMPRMIFGSEQPDLLMGMPQ